MGWGWHTPDKLTKLLKCSEFHDPTCGQPITDGCCPVIPCSYCLVWDGYDGFQYGTAPLSGSTWTGTIAGATFAGFWEMDIYGDCEFVVTLDGVEVYRKSCYEGQSCRDSSDHVDTTISYEDGTLTWQKIDHRPLEYVTDYDTQCKVHFCGTCECTCECLCVEITDEYTGTVIAHGEICDTAYPCDGPVWEGQVGSYNLSLALADCNDACCIVVSEGGYEVGEMGVTGCTDMTGTILLDFETRLTVTCKVCECVDNSCPCCPGWPLTASGIINWTTAVETTNDCESAPSTVEVSSDFGCPNTEDTTGTLLRTAATELWVRVFCDADTEQWKVQYRSATSGGGYDPPASATWLDAPGVTFVCPDCANAVGGIATGTIDFIAEMACEVSGPTIVPYNIIVHGDVEISCP